MSFGSVFSNFSCVFHHNSLNISCSLKATRTSSVHSGTLSHGDTNCFRICSEDSSKYDCKPTYERQKVPKKDFFEASHLLLFSNFCSFPDQMIESWLYLLLWFPKHTVFFWSEFKYYCNTSPTFKKTVVITIRVRRVTWYIQVTEICLQGSLLCRSGNKECFHSELNFCHCTF